VGFRLALCTLIVDEPELAYFRVIKKCTADIAKLVTDTMIVSVEVE